MRAHSFFFMVPIIALSLLLGCVTLTPAEQSYLDRVAARSSQVRITAKSERYAWGRVQSFIGQHSSMKIQTVTDFVIQTYNPSENQVDFGYTVTKTPGPKGDFELSVNCFAGNSYASGQAQRNAKILVDYLITGELPYPQFIAR